MSRPWNSDEYDADFVGSIASEVPAGDSSPDTDDDCTDLDGGTRIETTEDPPPPPEMWPSATGQRLVWADRFARDLGAAADRLTVPLARVAKTVNEQRNWALFGHARAEDYCRERLDNTARWLRGLASLARAFDRFPGLERAVGGEDGRPPLGRTDASQIARVATAESLDTWIRLARSLDCRTLTEVVRAAIAANSAWPVEVPGPDSATASPATPDRDADAGGGGGGDASLDPSDADDREPRCEVRLPVPGPMRVAFDEARVLHSAVRGGDVPAADFVEALVAEAMTGLMPVDVERIPLQKARPVEAIENELARENNDWHWLDGVDVPEPAAIRPRDRRFDRLQDDTLEVLCDLQEIAVAPHSGTPHDLDRQLRQLLAIKDRIDRQLGRVLTYMGDHRAWRRLRFDSVEHYAAERLSMQRRPVQDRVRATRAIKRLPLLRAAYESEALGLQKTLLVARALGSFIVPRSIERTWVEHAQQVTVRRLRDEARVAEREWLEHGSWTPRPPLSDKEWWDSLALFPGTTRRRFERLVGIPGSEALRDSYTYLTLPLPESAADDFLAAIESRASQLSQAWITRSAEGAANAPAVIDDAASQLSQTGITFSADGTDEGSLLPLAMRVTDGFLSRGLPLPSWVGLLALLEEYLATWDPAKAPRRTRHGAIYGRDGYRCAVPGCTSRRNLEAHHIKYQSQGGGDEPENLVTLCRFHHKLGSHGELGVCSGKAPLGMTWRLGREDVAQRYRNDIQIVSPLDALAAA